MPPDRAVPGFRAPGHSSGSSGFSKIRHPGPMHHFIEQWHQVIVVTPASANLNFEKFVLAQPPK